MGDSGPGLKVRPAFPCSHSALAPSRRLWLPPGPMGSLGERWTRRRSLMTLLQGAASARRPRGVPAAWRGQGRPRHVMCGPGTLAPVFAPRTRARLLWNSPWRRRWLSSQRRGTGWLVKAAYLHAAQFHWDLGPYEAEPGRSPHSDPHEYAVVCRTQPWPSPSVGSPSPKAGLALVWESVEH